MVIASGSDIVTIRDIAVGEVWIAGGQSNMEFYMRYEKHKSDALQHCKNQCIRFYDVPKVCYDGQLEDFDYSRMGIWRTATPEDLEYFSAVGYYFQKEFRTGAECSGEDHRLQLGRDNCQRLDEPGILRACWKTVD